MHTNYEDNGKKWKQDCHFITLKDASFSNPILISWCWYDFARYQSDSSYMLLWYDTNFEENLACL